MFKINIGTKEGKTFKLEVAAPGLEGKELGEKIKGEDISPDFMGYEFEIKGASDKAGFTALSRVEGLGLKKVLLSYEKGMKKRPKYEGKKNRSDKTPKGLRLRKTVRGKAISGDISQINLKLIKEGGKKLSEIFPDQNKAPEIETPSEATTEKTSESVKEESKSEEKPKETTKEETKTEEPAEKPKEAEDNTNPEIEPQKKQPDEDLVHPDEEPKEKESEEKAHPNEEPK